MASTAIGLGANLGDRRRHLEFALQALATPLSGLRVSTFHETQPANVPEPQPLYLNAVAIGTFAGTGRELLSALLAIERECGRERPYPLAPRTLDLDLILFGSEIIDTPDLVVPHPRFRERGFVLEPLVELAPHWVDPVTGKTIRELWRAWSAA